MERPNILLIMTDQERYAPPYESPELAAFRRSQMPARERLRSAGLELHRHYAGSTACLPSRATLFTGQYPSLHGVTKTDGLAKSHNDPAMGWLDPAGVPTMVICSVPMAVSSRNGKAPLTRPSVFPCW